MIKPGKLGHLVLSVRDCVRSRDFYVKNFGFKISSEDLKRGMVFLTLGDEHHVLALFQRATDDPPTADQPGIVHIAFALAGADDLQKARKELAEAGVAIEGDADDERTRGLYVRDPDNYCIEIFCHRAEGGVQAARAPDMTAAAGAQRH